MSTADYLRFCRMLAGGGEVDGVRVLAPKTVELMRTNHLPGGGDSRQFALPGGYGEVGFDGMGFGLTVAVSGGPAATQAAGSAGEYMWGGYASTIFWIDPQEDLVTVFMTQLVPSGSFNFRYAQGARLRRHGLLGGGPSGVEQAARARADDAVLVGDGERR